MNIVNRYSFSLKITCIILSFLLSAFFFCSWLSANHRIVDYVASRDKLAIKSMFADDWAMLISDESMRTYSVDFMLDCKSSTQHIKSTNLVLKVLRERGKTVGFVAYYPHSPFFWQLLFLVVDKQYRKRGFAGEMLQFAIDDMILHGAVKITIFTRLANISARALYQDKFGFKEIARYDNKYLDLVLYPMSRNI